ncbi:MAG: BlaI/MecI/CopY family transcriptional regulator [Clostridia bacterium]|nr:BlaI/MecI/CopY family transcriptional regulator [Clostridia bacterium]
MSIDQEVLKLCESDYRFMCVIWDCAPMTSRELVEQCAARLGWKKSTTYTTLKKLCEKGFAENVDTIVRPLIGRDRVQAYASSHFVDQTFDGSLPGFLAAFLGGKTISSEEAEALKQLIDRHKED